MAKVLLFAVSILIILLPASPFIHQLAIPSLSSSLNSIPNSTPLPLPVDADYSSRGHLPNAATSAFILSRAGPPALAELSDANLLKILHFPPTTANVTSDLEVNTLVWKCLGYRHVNGTWDSSACFPNFRSVYPSPPDFIGMQRIYSKVIDNPSLRANQALCKSVPPSAKQNLKAAFRQYNFTGFKLEQLTPNLTRRAQCANWLLYYREELWGKDWATLRRERAERQRKEQEEGGWRPPNNPVA